MTAMTDEAQNLDLTNVEDLVAEGRRLLREMDGIRIPEGNNPTRQSARRDLMYLADVLERAASEVKAAYWTLSDHPDVLR